MTTAYRKFVTSEGSSISDHRCADVFRSAKLVNLALAFSKLGHKIDRSGNARELTNIVEISTNFHRYTGGHKQFKSK